MSNVEFVVFLRRDGFETFQPPNERWAKVLADFRPYTWDTQTKFPKLIREAGVDLMHFTHFDHPIRCPVPFIITIHDLILLDHPSIRASTLGPLRFWIKYAAYRRVIHHAVHQSLRILTPSQTVKELIAERFGVMREKIIAAPLGADHATQIANPEGKQAPYEAGGKWQMANYPLSIGNSLFLLYIGNAYPHKNLEQFIRVMPELRKRHPELRLVLVGRKDDFYNELQARSSPRLERRGCKLQVVEAREAIVFYGPATEEERTQLLSNAAAYVSPSLAEGFDLPTLEAAALRTPIVATDIPAHREILGDAFLPFAPANDAALVEAIHRVLIHSELRATLVDRGIACARRFSWRRCAVQTLGAYNEALAFVNK